VLLAVFALIATGITALGSYGVMSQLVANRRREMAIRAALGATRGAVLRLVLGRNALLAGCGVVAGLATAWLAVEGLVGLVPGLDPRQPWPYGAVALGVLGLTQLASLVPAVQAARILVQENLR